MKCIQYALALIGLAVPAQQIMTIEEYEPKSTLVVPQHPLTRAKFPFIDVHGHQNGNMSAEQLEKLIREMDSINLRLMVNLSGGSGERLKTGLANLKGKYPNRFVFFANLDFRGIDEPGWGQATAERLEQDIKNGAQGLKIFKNLGMDLKDSKGERVHVDDARLNPVWSMCAKYKVPVLIHTGEPVSFFDPMDRHNERWLHLKEVPRSARPPERYPSWETIMGEQHALFRKHPKTTFINAHLGWLGNDLGRLGKLMDEIPNMYTELGAVISEVGRQPRFARDWFIKYQDRVLMGKDTWNATEFHTYFRVLETADEYFDYYRKRHAFWKMYGLNLPDEVLKKVYYKNAIRIIPGISADGFPK